MASANLMEWLKHRRGPDLTLTPEQAYQRMRAEELRQEAIHNPHYVWPPSWGGEGAWGGVSSDNETKEPASVPVPDRVALAEPEGPDAEYLALAAKLGIVSAAILEARLEQVLHEEMIGVYDYDKVAAYLNGLVAKRNYELMQETRGFMMISTASWGWVSLRAGEHKGVHALRLTSGVYQAAMPKPVLLTIERIQTRLPEARFFVSEIREVADPFLAVTVPGSSQLWVVERWDEPGFRG